MRSVIRLLSYSWRLRSSWLSEITGVSKQNHHLTFDLSQSHTRRLQCELLICYRAVETSLRIIPIRSNLIIIPNPSQSAIIPNHPPNCQAILAHVITDWQTAHRVETICIIHRVYSYRVSRCSFSQCSHRRSTPGPGSMNTFHVHQSHTLNLQVKFIQEPSAHPSS